MFVSFFEILHFFEEEVRDDRWNARWIGDELALKSVCSDNWSNSKVELQQNRSPSFAATLRNNDPKLGFGKSAGEIYSSPSASIVPTWLLVFSVQTLKNKNNWKTIFFLQWILTFFFMKKIYIYQNKWNKNCYNLYNRCNDKYSILIFLIFIIIKKDSMVFNDYKIIIKYTYLNKRVSRTKSFFNN